MTAAPCPYRGEVERLRAVITQAVADLEHAGGNYRTLWIGLALNGLREALPAVDRTPGGDTAASTIGAEKSAAATASTAPLLGPDLSGGPSNE